MEDHEIDAAADPIVERLTKTFIAIATIQLSEAADGDRDQRWLMQACVCKALTTVLAATLGSEAAGDGTLQDTIDLLRESVAMLSPSGAA